MTQQEREQRAAEILAEFQRYDGSWSAEREGGTVAFGLWQDNAPIYTVQVLKPFEVFVPEIGTYQFSTVAELVYDLTHWAGAQPLN